MAPEPTKHASSTMPSSTMDDITEAPLSLIGETLPPASAGPPLATEIVSYDNNIVRMFAMATVVWGVVGMLVGLIIAMKLYLPNFLGELIFSPTEGSDRCIPMR